MIKSRTWLLKSITRGKSLILAVFSVWPFGVILIGLFFEVTGMFPKISEELPAAFVLFYGLLLLTPIVVLALIGIYLVYLFTRPDLPLEWKLVWALVLILGNIFAMPLFWVLQVWKPRHLTPMRSASRFSLLIFAPALIAFLLPAAFLLPVGVAYISLTLFDPTISFSSVVSYVSWILGPIIAALVLFFIGRSLYTLRMKGPSSLVWMVFLTILSVALFLAIWLGITVLTSLAASDIPVHKFLSWTALTAAGLTLLSQVLLVPWLAFVLTKLNEILGLNGTYPARLDVAEPKSN